MKSNDWYLCKRQKRDRYREGYEKREAEIGILQPQTKEHQETPVRWDRPSPGASEESVALPTP